MTNDVKKSGLNTQAKCEPVIAFVIPCYNEEAALHVTADVLKKKVHQLENLHAVAENSFVDDGSFDEGVTSFSTKPLTMITGLGLFSVFVGIVMLVYTLVFRFSQGMPLLVVVNDVFPVDSRWLYSTGSWDYR